MCWCLSHTLCRPQKDSPNNEKLKRSKLEQDEHLEDGEHVSGEQVAEQAYAKIESLGWPNEMESLEAVLNTLHDYELHSLLRRRGWQMLFDVFRDPVNKDDVAHLMSLSDHFGPLNDDNQRYLNKCLVRAAHTAPQWMERLLDLGADVNYRDGMEALPFITARVRRRSIDTLECCWIEEQTPIYCVGVAVLCLGPSEKRGKRKWS